MTVFFIADPHFNHKRIIEICNRPFKDVDDMNISLVNNWNSVVTREDTVFVLGDVYNFLETKDFKKIDEDAYSFYSLISSLKGHKYLIKGNHDRDKGRLGQEWDSIQDYAEITDGEYFVLMSHYPMMFYNRQHDGAVMLYGHVHNTREWELVEKWKQELRQIGIPARIINVGCMMDYMNYTPRTLEELLRADSEKR